MPICLHSIGRTLGALDSAESHKHWACGAWAGENTSRGDFWNRCVKSKSTMSSSSSCMYYTLRNALVVEGVNLFSSMGVIQSEGTSCSSAHPSEIEFSQWDKSGSGIHSRLCIVHLCAEHGSNCLVSGSHVHNVLGELFELDGRVDRIFGRSGHLRWVSSLNTWSHG